MKKILLIGALVAIPYIAFAQQQAPQEFNLKITAADIQTLGEALGAMPYNKIAPLMQKLQVQISQQQYELANKPKENGDASKPQNQDKN